MDLSSVKTKLLAYRRIECVPIEELDCDLYVRGMTGEESSRFESAQYRARAEAQTKGDTALLPLLPLLLSLTVCDVNGTLLFSTPEEANSFDERIKDRLLVKAQYINGMTFEAREEIKKKSGTSGSGTSSQTDGEGQLKS